MKNYSKFLDIKLVCSDKLKELINGNLWWHHLWITHNGKILTPVKDARYKRKSKQDYKTKPSLNYIPNKLIIIKDKEKTGIFKLFINFKIS